MADIRSGLIALTAVALAMAASLRAPEPWDMAAAVIAAILGAAAVLLLCLAAAQRRSANS